MTEAEWRTYFDSVRSREAEVYISSPARLTATFTEETSLSKSYHGRELLELLQNADDHGPNSRTGRVAIRLSEAGICFANKGSAFPKDGVLSLVVANHSPKLFDKVKFIGNKGLGFRSILNWTDSPFILSQNMRLGFDRDFAKRWLAEICSKHAEVAQEVEKYTRAGFHDPVATLVCPFFLGVEEEQRLDDRRQKLVRQAEALIGAGYTTAVGLPLNSGATEEVERQLRELVPETLLFLKRTRQISIQAPGYERSFSIRPSGEDRMSASCDGRHYNRWQMYTKRDVMSQDETKPLAGGEKCYEIAVAVPERDTGTGKLFVYLPTECSLPLGVLAHATLETDQSRNHLVWSEQNRHILVELAGLVAHVAEAFAKKSASWHGLQLAAPWGSLDSVIERAGFESALVENLKKRRVVPCMDHTSRLAQNARSVGRVPIHASIARKFPDVCMAVPPELASFVGKLEIPVLSRAAICDRISRASTSLSMENRACVISSLARADWLNSGPVPNLFVDAKGRIISSEERVLLPPGGAEDLDLAEWVPIKVVSKSLTTRIKSALGVTADQDIIGKLDGYELRAYRFDALCAAVQSETNRLLRDLPAEESRIRRQALVALYELYVGSVRTALSRPSDVEIWVPRMDGNYDRATNLYFGEGYAPGKLCSALLGGVSPAPFVATPKDFGLEGNLTEFLTWAGVATWPRMESQSSLGSQYNGYVKRVTTSLKLPLVFDYNNDFPGQTAQDVIDARANVLNAKCPQHLEVILDTAPAESVIAWVMLDEELLRLSQRDQDATLRVHFGQKQNPRTLQGQKIESLAWWLLRSTPWVPTMGGVKRRPSQTALGFKGTDELRDLVPSPVIDHAIVAAYCENEDVFMDLEQALQMIGVARGVECLSWEELYGLAVCLPTISPDGGMANALYGAMLAKFSAGSEVGEAVHAPAELTLWCRHLGKGAYLPSAELRYNDRLHVPESVAPYLRLLHLPKGAGADLVRNTFGVSPLRKEDITVKVTSHEPNPLSGKLIREIEALKPFALALRMGSDSQGRHRRKLRDMRPVICLAVRGTATVGLEEIEVDLTTDGEYAISETESFLVLGDAAAQRGIRAPRTANYVASFMAAVLDTERMPELAQIASAPALERAGLLADILGNEAGTLLEKASKYLEISLDDPGFSLAVPSPVVELGIQAKTRLPEEIRSTVVEPQQPTDYARRLDLTNPTVVQETLDPKPHRRPVPLVYSLTRGAIQNPRVPRQVDPNRCQEIAIAFERSQSRFPIPVDTTRGFEGPGCDVLSFSSAKSLRRFQESGDQKLVARFIEVKGSATRQGAVTLGGNELASALDYGDRYFLYRVHEDEAKGIAQIVTLANPASVAHTTLLEIDPYVARNGAALWELRS